MIRYMHYACCHQCERMTKTKAGRVRLSNILQLCSANVTNMWYCIVLYCIAWHYVIIALPISPTCACAKPFDAQMTKTGRSGLSSISLVKDYASKIICYLYQLLFAICITYYLLFVSTVKEFLITRSSSGVSAANDALSHHKG